MLHKVPLLRRQSLSAPRFSLTSQQLFNQLGSFSTLLQILLAISRSVKNNKAPTRVIGGHKRKILLPKGKALFDTGTLRQQAKPDLKKLKKTNNPPPSLARGNVVVLTCVKIIFQCFMCRLCSAKYGNDWVQCIVLSQQCCDVTSS